MFKIKQKVVCVVQAERSRPEIKPIVGDIYTIRDVREDGAVLLEEIINEPRLYDEGHCEVWFLAELFRPVDHTFGAETVEKLEKILQPEEKEIFI